MQNYQYVFLIPLLPFLGFLILGLFGRKYVRQWSGFLATGGMLMAAGFALYTAWLYFFRDTSGAYQPLTILKYNWLEFSPGMSIDMGILLDPISVMMLVVITFVSLMVHIFSIGYMKGEERYATYFSFLSLFTFSMTGLVLSTNILQIYIFWELVGLSSYLLIGFYFQKPAAVAASKKAFIVTRFADLGFLVGILVVGYYAETLDFNLAIERLTNSSPQYLQISGATFLGISLLTWALTLIFIGGAGKSAMFPLHVWLPDAMEGPTPVSALIHAATMVVAGVYLVARLFPVFANASPAALQIVLYTGLLSSLLAAGIACTQTDIKRVLAYSTMSQIGFMMFSLGVSQYGGDAGLGFSASMFHLFTHAFFKSLLFLCAGAIIHQVHSNEMKNMGGLRKLMPVTHVAFLIACLSISAVPPFSGFFSKEEILLAVKEYSSPMYWLVLLISTFTAFYMFRLYFSIFWRTDVHEKKEAVHPHSASHSMDGPLTMRIPIIILALASLLAGFVPFGRLITSDGKPLHQHLDFVSAIVPVAFALLGIFFAARLYLTNNDKAERLAATSGVLYWAALRKFYIDEIYVFMTKKVIFNLVGRPAAWIDKNLVDGTVNGVAHITAGISEQVKGLQSGKIQNYALVFFGGIAGLTILVIYFWK